MKKLFLIPIVFFPVLLGIAGCKKPSENSRTSTTLSEKEKEEKKSLRTGAERTETYLNLLKDKKVGLVVNQTAVVGSTHLVDTLLSRGVAITKIFAPEHGFRGTADAGETVKNGTDIKTGLQIISLYGKNKKPSPDQIADIDILVFDIQDVGVRFYTYISTMHYVMEAAAENGKQVIVLDRPNPNGQYIDGPVLDKKFTSFVGMHPIPLVHGLTVGELANMINGEGWLKNGLKCNLKVIPSDNYVHSMSYSLPVKPSPNLPNDQSIELYPSLGLFEGTNISMGRGTDFPFQVIGYPDSRFGTFTFSPRSTEGAKNPPYEGKTCYGIDLRNEKGEQGFTLKYLIDFYSIAPDKASYFLKSDFINLLAGTDQLKKQIESGMTEKEIRKSWEPDLEKYREMRKKYLLYK